MMGIMVITNIYKQWLYSRRSGGYPNGVEVTLLDGSRKHFLPSELELISRAAEATDHQAPRLELKLHYAGPWRASYEDVDFTREANPESFVVSLTACRSLKTP